MSFALYLKKTALTLSWKLALWPLKCRQLLHFVSPETYSQQWDSAKQYPVNGLDCFLWHIFQRTVFTWNTYQLGSTHQLQHFPTQRKEHRKSLSFLTRLPNAVAKTTRLRIPEASCYLQLVDLNKTNHRGTLYLGRWKRWWLHENILPLQMVPTAKNITQSMVSLHSTLKQPIWFLHREWESVFWMWYKNFWNASFPVN